MALITGASGDLIKTLMTFQPYKPGQGRYARLGTLAVLVVGIIWAARSSVFLFSTENPMLVRYGIPAAVGLIAGWAAYRLIHWPRFADFLITTESEIAKVTWPSKREVQMSTIVVIVLSLIMAAFLYSIDRIWQFILYMIGILEFMTTMLGDG